MRINVHVAVRTAFSLVTITGVTGNILVCLVVLLNKPMRTPMNYLLVNLAISDLLLLVFFSPSFIFRDSFTHPVGSAGDLFCIFITGESFAWMGGYASAYVLVAIAIERYQAVTKPYHHHSNSITSCKLRFLVLSCWVFAISWNSIGFAVKRYDPDLGFCKSRWPAVYSYKVYSLLCFVIIGVIPVTTMCILYSRIVYSLWFKREIVQVNNQLYERKRRIKATKMVLMVSGIYTLSWIPELTIFLVDAYAPRYVSSDVVYPVCVAMVTLNSAVNPIIYTLHGERFRYFLKKLVCCCWLERYRSDHVPAGDRDGQDGVTAVTGVTGVTLTQAREVECYDTKL